jgi:HTH-like domain
LAANRRQYTAEFRAKLVLCTQPLAQRTFGAGSQHFWPRRSEQRSRTEDCRPRTIGGAVNHPVGDSKKSLDLLESGAKREAVRQLSLDYPIATVCQVLDYPRSQVYYEPQPTRDETDIKAAITTVAGQYPTYGYRRITGMLNRRGEVINHKRVAVPPQAQTDN